MYRVAISDTLIVSSSVVNPQYRPWKLPVYPPNALSPPRKSSLQKTRRFECKKILQIAARHYITLTATRRCPSTSSLSDPRQNRKSRGEIRKNQPPPPYRRGGRVFIARSAKKRNIHQQITKNNLTTRKIDTAVFHRGVPTGRWIAAKRGWCFPLDRRTSMTGPLTRSVPLGCPVFSIHSHSIKCVSSEERIFCASMLLLIFWYYLEACKSEGSYEYSTI